MKPSLDWLLVLVPVAIVLEIASGPDLAIFLTAALAILPLAGLIGRSTEQLALHTGPRVGGLINATFGNVTELIIAIFLTHGRQGRDREGVPDRFDPRQPPAGPGAVVLPGWAPAHGAAFNAPRRPRCTPPRWRWP